MNLVEINKFAEERGIKVRYLKTKHQDVLVKEGRKVSVDVDAYEEKLKSQERKSKKGDRNPPVITDKVKFKRELDKFKSCDDLITTSGQELEKVNDKLDRTDDEYEVAFLTYERDKLEFDIDEKRNEKSAIERKLNRLMPPSLKNKKNKDKDQQ